MVEFVEAEDWFEHLQQLRAEAHNPTIREVGRRAGLSAASVHTTMSGKHLPKRETLLAVVRALTDDVARCGRLMDNYDAEVVVARSRTRVPSKPDAHRELLNSPDLVAAVNRLTTAVNRVGDLMEKALFGDGRAG